MATDLALVFGPIPVTQTASWQGNCHPAKHLLSNVHSLSPRFNWLRITRPSFVDVLSFHSFHPNVSSIDTVHIPQRSRVL